MNKEEKDEMRQIVRDIVFGYHKENEAMNLITNEKLDVIKTQVLKTNGRVDSLEKDVHNAQMDWQKHDLICPSTDRFIALEKFMNKSLVIKKFALGTISLVAILTSILAVIWKVLEL